MSRVVLLRRQERLHCEDMLQRRLLEFALGAGNLFHRSRDRWRPLLVALQRIGQLDVRGGDLRRQFLPPRLISSLDRFERFLLLLGQPQILVDGVMPIDDSTLPVVFANEPTREPARKRGDDRHGQQLRCQPQFGIHRFHCEINRPGRSVGASTENNCRSKVAADELGRMDGKESPSSGTDTPSAAASASEPANARRVR